MSEQKHAEKEGLRSWLKIYPKLAIIQFLMKIMGKNWYYCLGRNFCQRKLNNTKKNAPDAHHGLSGGHQLDHT